MSSEKIEAFWENATAEDVARVMAGETVEARFRDSETRNWSVNSCKLKGWTEGSWACNEGLGWVECQVYREPSWYTERPDPGPEHRLLGKFPDEPKLGTDEAWDCHLKEWHEPCNNGIQQDRVWYRRRIEPVEPKPQHYVLRVGDSCETPCVNRTVVISQERTQSFVNFGVGDKVKTIHGQTITITEKGFEVTQ
jgi:hypothetical protein